MNREITTKKVGRQKKLTQEEEEILMLTEEIWNRFLALPINHPMEANEMAMKIHDIQRMIISRPGFRNV